MILRDKGKKSGPPPKKGPMPQGFSGQKMKNGGKITKKIEKKKK
jgi:hypothetical protein|tara:strand:+ start:2024 stop:2155 length:132 start_codon:yes stop_codon:yes gene_type:complete